MLDLCLPCKEKGKFRAVYKVVGGVPMCGGCVADREANPPEPAKPQAPQPLEEAKDDTEEKGKTMAKQINEETKAQILRDAAAGMNTNAIATKHGIGWITAKNIIDGNGKTTGGKKRAGGATRLLHRNARPRSMRRPLAHLATRARSRRCARGVSC